jgi:hypothetical protein
MHLKYAQLEFLRLRAPLTRRPAAKCEKRKAIQRQAPQAPEFAGYIFFGIAMFLGRL